MRSSQLTLHGPFAHSGLIFHSVKMNEKYTVMTPFGVINKMLGPQMFSPTSRETLGDKIELYFHDPSFVPLFMQVCSLLSWTVWFPHITIQQENYLKTQPSRIRNTDGPEKTLKHLELMYKAAESLSDGDIVDSLIHGLVPATFTYNLLDLDTATVDLTSTGHSCHCMQSAQQSALHPSCTGWAPAMVVRTP